MNIACLKIALLALSALVLVPYRSVAQTPILPAKDRMVMLISLDGFPAYYLADPKLPAPTLRSLIQNGSWAKEMQPVNPTWTWPNHTTLVTGLKPPDHGLLYNGSLIRQENPLSVKVDWSVPKVQMVQCQTLYDIAHSAGLTTAQVDWVAINDAPTITWAFPEKASASDVLVKEMIANHALNPSDVDEKAGIVWRDQIWTRAGAYLTRQHKPNLLLFHLLSLDSTHHAYGPKGLAGYDTVAFLDGCVKQLVDAVKDAGMIDRTTFFIVSDHGFRAVHKQILLKNVLAQAKIGAEVQTIPEGGSAMIYAANDHQTELLSQLRGLFSKTEGVQRVVDAAEYPSLGFPLPAKDRQMPNLLVFAQPGYAFSAGKGDARPAIAELDHATGAHGYPNTDPEMQAIFIANGYGIRSGVTLDRIQNTSVAPTLAQFLGVQLPKPESMTVLKQILQ